MYLEISSQNCVFLHFFFKKKKKDLVNLQEVSKWNFCFKDLQGWKKSIVNYKVNLCITSVLEQIILLKGQLCFLETEEKLLGN